MTLQERRLTELIDQVRALLVQAAHGDDNAYEQAEAVAREAIHLNPGNGAATQALYNSEAGGQLNKAYRLRNLRADRLLEALYLVELSHVPFPDEPPVRVAQRACGLAGPDRATQEMGAADRHEEAGEPDRAADRRPCRPDCPSSTSIPQPLKDAIDFIAQRYQIPIILDAKALEDASIDAHTSTEVKLPYSNMKLPGTCSSCCLSSCLSL